MKMHTEFKPIILGTDINAYGVARSFHEAYGVTSLCLGIAPLSPTQHSSICSVETRPDFQDDAVFLMVLDEVGKRFQEPLLLISCGDGYTALITRHRERLKERYVFNYIDHALQVRLENKAAFYAACEAYGLDYPETQVITPAMKDDFVVRVPFPVALKPDDSIAYLAVDFAGKKKAYRLETEEELRRTVHQIYDAGYTGDLIVQDFIPGDFSTMAVLNAYVDSHGKVTMMCLGRCLLDECLPKNIGNYNALVTMSNPEVYDRFRSFLEQIQYRGFANFDLKYDARDGKLKVFEINIRQGRSSYYMTAGGCNFVTYLVEDLIHHREVPEHDHAQEGLWLYVDPYVLKKYCAPGDRDRVKALLKRGFAFTQWYEKDRSLARWLMYWRRRLSTIRYYPKLQPGREE